MHQRPLRTMTKKKTGENGHGTDEAKNKGEKGRHQPHRLDLCHFAKEALHLMSRSQFDCAIEGRCYRLKQVKREPG